MSTAVERLLADAQMMWGDWLVVAVYFASVIGVGVWSSCRNRGSTQGYFLAGRSMHWIPVGASLFASNIGSGHFVGLAGSGASTGIGIAVFEMSATYVLLILGWVFVPVYITAGVFTMPEYLSKRFGGQRIRVYLSILSVALYIFTKISVDMYSGAIFLKQAIGLDIYVSAIVLLFMAMLFTIAGGLTAVIWTDFAQTAIMLVGATALSVISFIRVGEEGAFESTFESMTNKFFAAYSETALTTNSTCANPPPFSMNIMRPATLTSDLPWTGVTFGLFISSVWYWCSDQVIVQRVLAAKNISHARAGTILAGYLKFTPLWLLVFPGMISRILFPDVVGCANEADCLAACDKANGCTDLAYPLLVMKLMPNFARGLMISVMMSALMSSLTSIFNSSSTLFTMDLWTRVRKNASETELLVVGRIFVAVLAGVSIAWIPILDQFSELFHYIQEITSYLSPPVCAVYVLAVAWKRINEQGAFWGLMVGLAVGLTRFILEFAVYGKPPPCGSDKEYYIPDIIGKVHYLHFGCILFATSFLAIIVISILTKPINPAKLRRMTYLSRNEPGKRLDQDADENLPEHLQMYEEAQSSEHVVASTAELTPIDDEDENLPWWRVAINWICGIEKQSGPQMSDEELAEIQVKHLSIDEETKWRLLNNVNAIILILFTTFIWAYFG